MEEGERAENIAATCERPSPSMSLCDFLFREHLIRDRSEIWSLKEELKDYLLVKSILEEESSCDLCNKNSEKSGWEG